MEKPDTTGHERERGHELGNEPKCDHVLNVTGNRAHNYYTDPKNLRLTAPSMDLTGYLTLRIVVPGVLKLRIVVPGVLTLRIVVPGFLTLR